MLTRKYVEENIGEYVVVFTKGVTTNTNGLLTFEGILTEFINNETIVLDNKIRINYKEIRNFLAMAIH